ncbi:phosphatidylinositol N-acetylglucosaminyltransferase subunit H [Anabrus simplex]|uniref:phosphatidylinositol N-acetylglucosaminyltransferase subunit H n=1 Tax=Anabrus simplex TaxID=316456 RepID=UPI0035A2FC7F
MSNFMECDSVDGKKLNLNIDHHDVSNLCSEFTVKNLSTPSVIQKLAIVSWIIMLYLSYCCIFEISITVSVFVLIIVFYQVYRLVWCVKSETLLVISFVGLQFTTTFLCGNKRSQFIPWHSVSDVIINEAISLHRVIYYLAVIIQDGDSARKLIPLFQYTTPRLACLEQIYRGVQTLLGIS